MPLFRLLSLALVCLGLSAPAQAATDGMEALIEKVLAAHGGLEALQAHPAERQFGEVTSTSRHGTVGTVTRLIGGSDKLRVQVDYPSEAPEIRILNGDKGWHNGVAVEGPMLDAMKLQAARLRLPLILWEHRDQATMIGDFDKPAIAIPLGNQLYLKADLDPDTWRVVSSDAVMTMGDKADIRFQAYYGEFKEWSTGVLRAGFENQFAMGQNIGQTRLSTIDFLDQVPEAEFAPD